MRRESAGKAEQVKTGHSGADQRGGQPDAARKLTPSCGGNAEPACFGGVTIAERHGRKGDEDGRLLAKYEGGCRFFISQTVYDAGASKSLLSDYALRFKREGLEPAPFILSFSPCGSLKTMEFMKWLGISFPRWLENELRHTPDILGKSVDLAQQVFTDILEFAERKGIPVGVNVESVSIRKDEIEASCELFAGCPACWRPRVRPRLTRCRVRCRFYFVAEPGPGLAPIQLLGSSPKASRDFRCSDMPSPSAAGGQGASSR